jgi:hypothetical protein
MENRLSPMRELLGELRLETKQPADALAAFEASLKNVPNRCRSLAGAAKAAGALGDRTKARSHYASLVMQASSRSGATPTPNGPVSSRRAGSWRARLEEASDRRLSRQLWPAELVAGSRAEGGRLATDASGRRQPHENLAVRRLNRKHR